MNKRAVKTLIFTMGAHFLALYTTGAQTLTPLYAFADSLVPSEVGPSSLVQGIDGNFYGTISYGGGSSGYGTIFKLTLTGQFTNIYTFTNGVDGKYPTGLIQTSDGTFYGIAEDNGDNGGYSTIFKFLQSEGVTTLHAFGGWGTDDGPDVTSLIIGSDGQLYGTGSGGEFDGNVFTITSSGTFSNLYIFGEPGYPSSLIRTADGTFYGITTIGGTYGFGSVFQLTASGVLSHIHSFNKGDGETPLQLLGPANDGAFYGLTYKGGAFYSGEIFKVTTSGGFSVLHSFAGTYPGALTPGPDGTYFVTADPGGIFKMTSDGTFTSLFNNFGPQGGSIGLIPGNNGSFYGIATLSTSSNYHDAIVQFNPTNAPPPPPVDPALVNGTFAVTETWSASLTYGFENKHFSGTEKGILVIFNGKYKLLNGTSLPLTTSFTNSVTSNGVAFDIRGHYPLGELYYGLDGIHIVMPLGCFTVAGNIGTNVGWSSFKAGRIFSASGASLVSLNGSSYEDILSGPTINTSSQISMQAIGPRPLIVSQPQNREVIAGSQTHFNIEAASSAPLTYKWLRSGKPLTDAGDFAGTQTPELTVMALHGDGGSYSVIVSNVHGSVTSTTGILSIDWPPEITSSPTSRTVFSQQPTAFNIAATGTGPLHFQWRLNGHNIAGATSAVLMLPATSIASAGSYDVVVANNYGTKTSSIAQLAVLPLAPAVTSPASGSQTSATTITITGTTASGTGVTGVLYTTGNGATNAASGTTAWTIPNLPLPAGPTVLKVWATNAYGSSPVITANYFRIVNSRITLLHTGRGTVLGLTNQQPLVIGRIYSDQAVAASNNVFSNWSGTISSSANPLTFTMQSNMVLQANFVTNICVRMAGIYNGLFSLASGPAQETAGMISHLVVAPTRTFTGNLLFRGTNYVLTGTFDVAGHAHNIVSAVGGNIAVDINLLWTSTPREITGTVSGNNGAPWSADLDLIASPAANAYPPLQCTMIIPPAADAPSQSPGGSGYALITNNSGTLTITGALPDGGAFNETTSINEAATVSFYASLYNQTGLIIGWLNMNTATFGNAIPSGTLTWIKKQNPAAMRYPNGFTNTIAVSGSRWITPTGPILPFTAATPGTLEFAGGDLSSPLSFEVALSNTNLVKVSGNPTNSLSGSIDRRTGMVKLKFGNGVGTATTQAAGALLQNGTNATGAFLGTHQSGTMTLHP